MSKKLLSALFVIFLFAAAGCLTVDEENATATAESGGVDRNFLSTEATTAAENGNYDNRVMRHDATATAQAGGTDDRLQKSDAAATAESVSIDNTAEAEDAIFDLTSTAIAIEEAEDDDGTPASGDRQVLKRGATEAVSTPTPAPTPAPVPTVAPVPTPTSPPAPTATTQAIELNQWLTAFQAIDLLAEQQSGIVWHVGAHVSTKAGQLGSGDLTASIPSPGAGYSALWEMSVYDEGDKYFCTVWLQGTLCELSSYADDSDKTDESIAGASVDSVDVIEFWAGVPEWIELTRNADISILLVLWSSAGADSPLLWQASITVHNATDGLRSGNFNWIPETGESNFTTFPPQ